MMKRKAKKKKRLNTLDALRLVRDQISMEIKNMTFEEEKAYLKRLLAENDAPSIAAEPRVKYGKH